MRSDHLPARERRVLQLATRRMHPTLRPDPHRDGRGRPTDAGPATQHLLLDAGHHHQRHGVRRRTVLRDGHPAVLHAPDPRPQGRRGLCRCQPPPALPVARRAVRTDRGPRGRALPDDPRTPTDPVRIQHRTASSRTGPCPHRRARANHGLLRTPGRSHRADLARSPASRTAPRALRYRSRIAYHRCRYDGCRSRDRDRRRGVLARGPHRCDPDRWRGGRHHDPARRTGSRTAARTDVTRLVRPAGGCHESRTVRHPADRDGDRRGGRHLRIGEMP